MLSVVEKVTVMVDNVVAHVKISTGTHSKEYGRRT
jgi:hypothetical protein